jgi:putative transcriptional regulator
MASLMAGIADDVRTNFKERILAMLENRVRELRARFKMSQSDLAEKVGITRQTVGLIEKGDYSPSVVLALKLARVFGTTVEEVFWLRDQSGEEGEGNA